MSVPPDPASQWLEAFGPALERGERAEVLQQASLNQRLGDWTGQMTGAVVEACRAVGWVAAARGFPLGVLPQEGQEYLGIDVMAFRDDGHGGGDTEGRRGLRWHFPVAVFELENSALDDRVAYSLWKVLCVRVPLRGVFAYRQDWDRARALLEHLRHAVVDAMAIDERLAIAGETVVVLGSRGEGETFPHGYFKMWRLNGNTGRFEKM